MNPSSNETRFNAPGPELPAPVGVPEASGNTPERTASSAEKAPASGQQSSAALPTIPMPLPTTSVPTGAKTDDATTTANDVTSTALDGDLIEKEWVEKAKKIVERTRDDPYTQSNELTAVKADYLQKRYNKTVKLDL